MARASKYIGVVITNVETGESLIVDKSPEKFFKEHGVEYGVFKTLIRGKIKICSGWFLGTIKPDVKRGPKPGTPLSEEHKQAIRDTKKKIRIARIGS